MEYVIDKHKLRRDVIDHIRVTHPELRPLLTAKRIEAAFVFVDGFLSCLRVMGEEPMRNKDIHETLVQEMCNHIIIRLSVQS